MSDTKRCWMCMQTKERTEFYKYANRKDGLDNKCKVCSKVYRAKNMTRQYTGDPVFVQARRLSSSARQRAVELGKPCDLEYVSTERFYPIVQQLRDSCCPVCAVPFDLYIYTPNGLKGAKLNSISIDCLNPEQGYVPGNIRFICYHCNTRKSTHTLESALALVNWFLQGAPDINNEALPCNTIKLPPILPASVSTS